MLHVQEKVVAMVMKELPGKKSDGNGAHKMAVAAHGESRPLLSPSVDDFLSETVQPTNHNPAVLSTTLDLVDLNDLSETCANGGANISAHIEAIRGTHGDANSPANSYSPGNSRRWSSRSKQRGEPDQVLTNSGGVSFSGGVSLSGGVSSSGGVSLSGGVSQMDRDRDPSNHLLRFEADFRSGQDSGLFVLQDCPQDAGEKRGTVQFGISRSDSTDEEFLKAKAAVESDTVFWDKMEEGWAELVRWRWVNEDQDLDQDPGTSTASALRDHVLGSCPPGVRTKSLDLDPLQDFNSTVHQNPNDAEAWRALGLALAEHENEEAAILCLQRCLRLRPSDRPALMALAVSLTNRGRQREACDALRCWLQHSALCSSDLQDPVQDPDQAPVQDPEQDPVQELLQLFQDAAQASDKDPDLHTGLGVLHSLDLNHEMAAQAFTTALSLRPEDAPLWNRLGASLANGARFDEAVCAYSRGLELRPCFIRCRYNLGLSLLQQGAHREALHHFLLALEQQKKKSLAPVTLSENLQGALDLALRLIQQDQD